MNNRKLPLIILLGAFALSATAQDDVNPTFRDAGYANDDRTYREWQCPKEHILTYADVGLSFKRELYSYDDQWRVNGIKVDGGDIHNKALEYSNYEYGFNDTISRYYCMYDVKFTDYDENDHTGRAITVFAGEKPWEQVRGTFSELSQIGKKIETEQDSRGRNTLNKISTNNRLDEQRDSYVYNDADKTVTYRYTRYFYSDDSDEPSITLKLTLKTEYYDADFRYPKSETIFAEDGVTVSRWDYAYDNQWRTVAYKETHHDNLAPHELLYTVEYSNYTYSDKTRKYTRTRINGEGEKNITLVTTHYY